MRTTITLDADVAERLRQRMRTSRKSFKVTVNEALRAGLSSGVKGPKRKPFLVRPHRSAFVPGVDAERLNQLADDVEADVSATKRG